MAIVTQSNKGPAKPDVFDVLMGDYDLFSTPLFNRLKKGPDSPSATLFQWPFDLADAPDTAGSVEGARFSQATTDGPAPSDGTMNNPSLMFGRMHHYKKTFGVGEVTAGDEVYGMEKRKQFAHRMRKALRKATKSAEAVIMGNQESQAGSTSVAFRTRGFETLILDTANIAAQTDSSIAISASFRPAAAQVPTLTITSGDYALTPGNLTDPFQAIYTALGSKIDLDIYCTTKFKGKVSEWGRFQATPTNYTAVQRFNSDAEDSKITAIIDTYVGDCGTARLELHWALRNTGTGQKAEALGLSLPYAQLRVRKAPYAKELSEQAAGQEGYVEWTMGLQATPKFQAQWRASTGS